MANVLPAPAPVMIPAEAGRTGFSVQTTKPHNNNALEIIFVFPTTTLGRMTPYGWEPPLDNNALILPTNAFNAQVQAVREFVSEWEQNRFVSRKPHLAYPVCETLLHTWVGKVSHSANTYIGTGTRGERFKRYYSSGMVYNAA